MHLIQAYGGVPFSSWAEPCCVFQSESYQPPARIVFCLEVEFACTLHTVGPGNLLNRHAISPWSSKFSSLTTILEYCGAASSSSLLFSSSAGLQGELLHKQQRESMGTACPTSHEELSRKENTHRAGRGKHIGVSLLEGENIILDTIYFSARWCMQCIIWPWFNVLHFSSLLSVL